MDDFAITEALDDSLDLGPATLDVKPTQKIYLYVFEEPDNKLFEAIKTSRPVIWKRQFAVVSSEISGDILKKGRVRRLDLQTDHHGWGPEVIDMLKVDVPEPKDKTLLEPFLFGIDSESEGELL